MMQQWVGFAIPAAIISATMMLTPPVYGLTASEVQAIAAEITVLIDGINPGSGVIIARDRTRYFVLTARHVVATEDEYWIVTSDGREHLLDYQTVRQFPEVDLAVLEFRSDRTYPVATLAAYPYDQEFPYVFVSGWLGSLIQVMPLEHHVSGGLLLRQNYALVQAQDPLAQGYKLFYTSITERGMSGGPVLDTEGRVIGIHGRSEGEEFYNADTGDYSRLMFGFSAGIPIQSFLQSAASVGLSANWTLEVDRPAPLTAIEQQSIQAILEPPPLTDSTDPIAWTNLGNQLFRLERFSEAQAAFEQAVQLQPDFYQAWYGLGQVFTTEERYEEALSAYSRALQIQPSFANAMRDRALVYIFLDQPQMAVTELDRMVQQVPDDYVAWYLRGNLFRQYMNWPEAALGAYDRAVELAPNFILAWVERGRVLDEMGQPNEALNSLQQAIRLDAEADAAWYWQGQILLQSNQISEALIAVDQAIAIHPENPDYWLLRAKILLPLGNPQRVREALYEVLNYDPGNSEAHSLLDSLE